MTTKVASIEVSESTPKLILKPITEFEPKVISIIGPKVATKVTQTVAQNDAPKVTTK